MGKLFRRSADRREDRCIDGEAALAGWSAAEAGHGTRLLKSGDDHFVFQASPGGNPIASVSTVAPNTWYHIALTKTDDLLTLYLNGKAEATGKPAAHFATHEDFLFLGASEPGRPSLYGWMDEIALYNRGLTADEVVSLYQQRAVGPCRTN